MGKEEFELLGHDNPLGYPAPVVPVGVLNNRLVAIYASDKATEVVLNKVEDVFIIHNDFLQTFLMDFNYLQDRLFGFNERLIDSYPIEQETEYFRHLLKNPYFSKENVFMRLSLAKASKDPYISMQEISLCLTKVNEIAPSFTDIWYETQLRTFSQLFGRQLSLPERWQDLNDLLSANQQKFSRKNVKRPLRESERQKSIIEPRQTIASLYSLSDEELVDAFLDNLKVSRNVASLYFEVIVGRYQWIINHIIRNSHYRFPAWDSADDVIARVIFKVYRGLALWRRQGKLSSFIARIATSEMIDTIRRVGRDKSWNPRQAAPDPDADETPVVETATAVGPSPEAVAASREQSEIIEQFLADVCRDWKDYVIINEYIIGKQSAKEIADKYDITKDVVYHRARGFRVLLMNRLKERGITSAEKSLGASLRVGGQEE